MRYVVVGGSFEFYHDWYLSADSLFNTMMRAQGFELGPRFRWNGGITAIDFEAASEALGCAVKELPYDDRNFVCYSNGGRAALFLAADGFDIRTLTTVGTPYRLDVPVDRAEDHIGYHQHIYDERDPVRWLGEIDFFVSLDRRFHRARNYNLRDIGHGRVFFEQRYIGFWEQMGWLAAMRDLETVAEAVA